MLNQKLQQSSNYACDMLISIFSKDESNFLCKGYMTILDRNLRFGLLAFFLYQMQKNTLFITIKENKYIKAR